MSLMPTCSHSGINLTATSSGELALKRDTVNRSGESLLLQSKTSSAQSSSECLVESVQAGSLSTEKPFSSSSYRAGLVEGLWTPRSALARSVSAKESSTHIPS